MGGGCQLWWDIFSVIIGLYSYDFILLNKSSKFWNFFQLIKINTKNCHMASTPFTNLLLYEDLIWKINLDISKNRPECGKFETPHEGQRKFLMEREAGSKGLNDALPGQKLCRQCLTEYEKLTKPNENKNMIENFQTGSPQDDLASDDDFLLYESPKEKLNSTLELI